MQPIAFNAQSAKQADAPRAISQTGKYVGGIITAEIYDTDSGAEFIELIFKDTESSSLARINTCIRAKDGKETRSMGIIQALMGIVGAQQLTPTKGYFTEANGEKVEGFHLPELEKKPCGMLLQRQNDIYQNRNGEMKEFWQMVIASVFDAQTGQTYHEKAANKPAKHIEQRLARLTDYNTKRLQDWKAQGSPSGGAPAQSSGVEDMPEDIPF